MIFLLVPFLPCPNSGENWTGGDLLIEIPMVHNFVGLQSYFLSEEGDDDGNL